MPEIWLYHQPARQLEVLGCEAGRLASRRRFEFRDPIRSRALPRFDRTMGSVLDVW